MKTGLLRRVESLEQRANPGKNNEAIFIEIVSPGEIDKPVSGWFFRTGTEQVEVWRQAGESDDDLQKRTETLAREHLGKGCSPLLVSLKNRKPKG